MTVSNNDVIRTTVDMRYASVNVIQNTFHCRYTGASGVSEQSVVDAIRNEIEGALWTVVDGDLSLNLTFIAYLNFNVTQDAPMPDAIPVLVTAGINANETLPLQVAALMSFPSAVSRSIGRKYIAAYTEVSTSGAGVILVPELARLVTAASNLFGSFTILAGNGIFGNYVAVPPTFIPWTSSRVDSILRTQRRRVPGVGV